MRVLVVDDSTLFRKVVRNALAALPDVEVVGSAADGRKALEKIEQLKPDLVTLDVEMPMLNGLEVLQELHSRPSPPAVIMVSGLTDSGATLTAQALQLGAFDFILKPNAENFEANLAKLQQELVPRVRHLAQSLGLTSPDANESSAQCVAANSATSKAASNQPTKAIVAPILPPKIVAIGISTGGPAALAKMLPRLPASLPIPVVIVQHMPALFTKSLADDLDRSCALHIQEGADGTKLSPGNVYIAPGGKQMRIEHTPLESTIVITDDPPERSCKPAVDYLFRDLAQNYGDRVLAVIMTGMGDDGTLGCRLLKRKGCRVIAQDQASCVVYGMPRQVIDAGYADIISPLDEIHQKILEAIHPPKRIVDRESSGAICR